MSTTVVTPPLTTSNGVDIVRQKMSIEDFLAICDEPGVDRMLINGELWEKPVTVRNRSHAFAEIRVGQRLQNHIDERELDALAASGEAGVIFEPLQSAVGIDVVVISQETLDAQDDSTTLIRGVPLMTVEILSGSETVDEVDAKLRTYLQAGVQLCWIVDPKRRTVIAHRPDQKPRIFSGEDPIDAEPALPGFEIPTVKLFER